MIPRCKGLRFLHRIMSSVLIGTLITCAAPPHAEEEAPEPDLEASDQPSSVEEVLLELSALDPELGLAKAWTGDLDGMVERGFIRALVTYSKTNYFIDRGAQHGVSYEGLREFEKYLNRKLGRRTVKVKLVILPVARDELLPSLAAGLGDLAAANLTITPEREQLVDFSEPIATGVSELVVTGPAGPELSSLDDLAGHEVHVRRSSSYWDSLERLDRELQSRGLPAIEMVAAEEYLEDEDLLEMVNAGLIPTIVVDSHKAHLWEDVFDDIVVHDELAVRTGGEIAWAIRKDSPELSEMVDQFVTSHRKGTVFGNVVIKRYYRENPWIRNSLAESERQRFESMVELFVKYGQKYDFEPLMLGALAYQESHLDQSKRSSRGAIGVMQMLPSTAADPNVGIPDITDLENNIHAGTKYLAFLHERYFSDPEIPELDQTLFTFAAYNAGPGRVRQLRSDASSLGLDPNRWFGNVERAAARRVGSETVRYVSNITKYYIAYRLAVDQLVRKGSVDYVRP